MEDDKKYAILSFVFSIAGFWVFAVIFGALGVSFGIKAIKAKGGYGALAILGIIFGAFDIIIWLYALGSML